MHGRSVLQKLGALYISKPSYIQFYQRVCMFEKTVLNTSFGCAILHKTDHCALPQSIHEKKFRVQSVDPKLFHSTFNIQRSFGAIFLNSHFILND